MIPKELQRDVHGFTRLVRINVADRTLEKLRAVLTSGNIVAYADPDCHECGGPRECGLNCYRDGIWDAANAYHEAGLGLLADRVEALEAGTLDAWTAFDEANATTEI